MRYQKHRQSLACITPGSDDATINCSRGKNRRIREISTKGIIDNASDGSSHPRPRYDALHPRQEREKEEKMWLGHRLPVQPTCSLSDTICSGHFSARQAAQRDCRRRMIAQVIRFIQRGHRRRPRSGWQAWTSESGQQMVPPRTDRYRPPPLDIFIRSSSW